MLQCRSLKVRRIAVLPRLQGLLKLQKQSLGCAFEFTRRPDRGQKRPNAPDGRAGLLRAGEAIHGRSPLCEWNAQKAWVANFRQAR